MRLSRSFSTGSVRWGVGLSTLAAATALSLVPTGSPASAAPDDDLAPVVGAERDTAIEGQYVVVLEEEASTGDVDAAAETALEAGGEVVESFDAALSGFSAELPPEAVDALREDPDVAFIEADQRVHASGTQRKAPWNLDRIDQRKTKRDRRYRYTATGTNVTAYVIDSGIRATHRQFRGRVEPGFNVIRDGRGTSDCNGHGTHVAGIIGGNRFGVAKRVTLRPVRVLGCGGGGSNSGVIAGIDWVVENHHGGPAVANISLGGPPSRAMDAAVQRALADGVVVTVAAGNEGWDACAFSPGRTPAAITVGSTRKSDRSSGFSNYGSCVDLFAPGSGITSSWHRSDTATNTIDGTSMASPHVAGAAALYLQRHPDATAEQVKAVLLDSATTGKVTARRGTPNRLLFSRLSASPPNNLIRNPGFEAGRRGWRTSVSDVINDYPGESAYTGRWKAWLGGTGKAHKDVLQQRVTIPRRGNAKLSFYLRIRTLEGVRKAKDRMWVQVVAGRKTQTLATFSNRTPGGGMVRRTYSLRPWAGKTVTIRFKAREDARRRSNFVIDQVRLSTTR